MGKQQVFLKTMPLEEALSKWQEAVSCRALDAPLKGVPVKVEDSLGRITACPVAALASSPAYHASAMDGYAVRFSDTLGATEAKPASLVLGQDAVYVDTGDPMPDSPDNKRPFNAVIMVEDINVINGSIEFHVPATPWQHVRTVGEDMVATELIVPENHAIRAVDMGAMLAGGLTSVEVREMPAVAVIPTGTEIVEPGTPPEKGRITEFSSRMLGGLIEQWGGRFLRMPIVPDEPEKLRQAIRDAAARADVVAIIAGSSAGSEDHTADTVRELGDLVLHGVDIRPGKPTILGIVEDTPVIGLPGYPVATHLSFNLFARPLLKSMQGLEDTGFGHGVTRATLSRQVASRLGSDEFLRVKVGKVGGRLITTPLGRGAGMMMSLVRADGIIVIPALSEGIAGGSEVEVQLLRPATEIDGTVVSIGSHDNCMDVLANFLKKRHPQFSLSTAHVGSMGGLVALKRGEAHVAPTHLLDEETGEYNTPFLARLLPDIDTTLINLVQRTQGLIVPPGNPKGIKGIEDIRREDVTFINRQRGAGTRLLLDKTLKELAIDPAEITGYTHEEYTHMGVASAVLSGLADTGLGVLSAAKALGLDFVPVARERYDLAVPTAMLEYAPVAAMLEIIRNDSEFKSAVQALGGYDVSLMGQQIDRS